MTCEFDRDGICHANVCYSGEECNARFDDGHPKYEFYFQKSKRQTMRNLNDVIQALESAPRQGTAKDEPEGAQFVILSDALVKEMVAILKLEVRGK